MKDHLPYSDFARKSNISIDDCSTILSSSSDGLRGDIEDNEQTLLKPQTTLNYSSIYDPDDDDGTVSTEENSKLYNIRSARIDVDQPRSGWDFFKTRSKYYLPVLQWLPYYSCVAFGQDVLSGISLSFLFIPQALSYSTALCGIPAIHGLYTIAIASFVYALLGMSPQLSVGPEATVSLIIGSGIAHQPGSLSPTEAAAVASLTAILVGLFTLALGLLRFGFLDSLMSRALLQGFISAVAVVVMMQQSIILLGLGNQAHNAGIRPDSTTMERLMFICTHIRETHLWTLGVSIVSSTVIFGFQALKRRVAAFRRIPEILIVVIGSTITCRLWELDLRGVAVLGPVGSYGVNSPLPFPAFPSLPQTVDLKAMVTNAATISTIGFIESIAASKLFGRKHGYFVSANRELTALGCANIVGGFFQSFPAFGSFPRSKAHESMNPKTQMSGFISGCTTLLITAFFLGQLYYIPSATLSSVIFAAVVALLEELPTELTFMWKIRAWKDMGLLFLTFSTTVIFSLEVATSVAVMVSLIMTVKQSSHPRITIMGRVKNTMYEFKPIHDSRGKQVEHLEDILIVSVDEPLYFSNTGQFKDRMRRLENFGDLAVHPSETPRRTGLIYLIFDVGGMDYIDASAAQILYEIIESYHAQRTQVFLVNIHTNVTETIRRAGILSLVGSSHICYSVVEAIQTIECDLVTKAPAASTVFS
ncbi:hypothetical protein EC973_008645 [Apophysomyces ossiformis]|uniref:STAS domain-containing protein n=1 Tax=Apophysomyces ossiformis TaxID=679940 RepID=A0A8H7BKQ3_9FUNG|nr:hypothetical protein EC973_008645 [Apophysomyces ossiformis]